MSKQKDNLSLEEALDQYFSAPVPRKEFLSNLEQSLQNGSQITTRSLPRFHHVRTFRPVYAFLTVGLILVVSLLAVGPANAFAALQSFFRYIPGFGLVDEKTTLRVLAEPVSVTREGVTVIVKQAILSPEQVSITYTIKDIPIAAKPAWVASESGKICSPITEIHLQDGTHLEQQEGGKGGYDSDNNYQYVAKFPAIPAKDSNGVWFLPCLPDTLTGKAPSNWEIPLRFIPAPSNLTSLPVKEPTLSVSEVTPKGSNPLSLDKVIETEDGYIFIGQFRQVLPARVTGIQPQITDGNGLLQGYTIPSDITVSNTDQGITWAYQIHNKSISGPVTIRFDAAEVFCNDPQAKLTFDAGASPRPDQVWEINQDYSIGTCKFRIDFVKRTSKGYLIRFSSLLNINGFQLSPQIEGPQFTGGPGETSVQYPDHMDVTMTYDSEPPNGLITVFISAYGVFPGPWQVEWHPNK